MNDIEVSVPHPHAHPEVTRNTPAEQEMSKNKELVNRDGIVQK